MKRSAGQTALALGALAIFACEPRFFIRPELFSFVLLSAIMHVLLSRDLGGRPRLWLLPLLELLLANSHAFGLLGLLDAREDYEAIFRGLLSTNKKAHSTSHELLENVLPKALRHDVLEVVDDIHPTKTPPIEGTLRSLLDQSSLTLASLAAYHAKEIGLSDFEIPDAGRISEVGHGP